MIRTATVRMVTEEEASGKVADIYADIKATKGIPAVPNFWRVLASHPDNLEMIWTRLKALMHPEASGRESSLDPKTREIIALAVSATNGCPTVSTPTPRPCGSWAVTPKRWERSWPLWRCSTAPTPWPTAIRSHQTYYRPLMRRDQESAGG